MYLKLNLQISKHPYINNRVYPAEGRTVGHTLFLRARRSGGPSLERLAHETSHTPCTITML